MNTMKTPRLQERRPVLARLSVCGIWALSLTCGAGLLAQRAQAHSAQGHSAKKPADLQPQQKPWGIAGDPKRVVRTIEIRMDDAMRFTPERIEVQEGHTLRLRIRNTGKLMHELVIGTRQELDEHAALMKRFPTMAHDEPYMAHVDPGRSGEIVWHFNRAGEFEFACLIPGHYDAGMKGKIIVRSARAS